MIHHPYSPSKLERLELCPGSFNLESYEEEEREEAAEGTELHRLVADAKVDGEDKELVQRARNFLDTVREKFPGLGPWQYERKLRLIHDFEVLSEGTADVVGETDEAVIVVDWKFGYKEVTAAAQNLQILAYGAMAIQQANFAIKDAKRPLAHLYLYHPRLDKMTYTRMSLENYQRAVGRVKDVHTATRAEGLLLNPSEKACEYCPAKVGCPAIKRSALSLAKVHSSQITDPVAMGKLLQLAKLAGKWADSIEYHAKSMALKGTDVAGFKLQVRKGRRHVADPQRAFDLLSAHFTLPEFIEFCNLEVGKLEEAFVTRMREKQKVTIAAAKGQFETLLLPVLERGDSSVSLVAA